MLRPQTSRAFVFGGLTSSPGTIDLDLDLDLDDESTVVAGIGCTEAEPKYIIIYNYIL